MYAHMHSIEGAVVLFSPGPVCLPQFCLGGPLKKIERHRLCCSCSPGMQNSIQQRLWLMLWHFVRINIFLVSGFCYLQCHITTLELCAGRKNEAPVSCSCIVLGALLQSHITAGRQRKRLSHFQQIKAFVMVTCETSQRAHFFTTSHIQTRPGDLCAEFNFQLKKRIPQLEQIFRAHLISPYFHFRFH